MIHVRKDDHLRICLEHEVRPRHARTGLAHYRFVHQALPDLALDGVDLSAHFLGRALRAPLIISPMTGGTPSAGAINRRLGEAAQALGIGMGVGSQRAALEDPRLADTYRVRQVAPDVLLLANLGAAQLNTGYGVEHCQRVVDMIEADVLVLHLNPLQEALQAGGDTDFTGLVPKIERICRLLPVPVVVKEVGFGLSPSISRRLVEAGVAALDVAGAGGTSWSQVERYRAQTARDDQVASQFSGWGIPTADAVRSVRRAVPDAPLIASGGIETGIDVAKCIALGADLAGIAFPLLRPAVGSSQEVVDALSIVIRVLRIAMFCIGAGDVAVLRGTPYLEESPR